MKWAKRLEGVVLGGFGNEMLEGFVLGLLEDSTPIQTYEYIRDDTPLLDLPESEWEDARRLAAHVDVEGLLSRDRVLETLRKERSDLVSVILNHPKGLEWLDRQLASVLERLRAK